MSMFTTGPMGIQMPTQMLRVAGAQIPVGTNIQANKVEILKALDWGKENEVDHLLTPECSLSGYLGGWEDNIEEIKDALKEIEEHQAKCNLYLHLGTNFEEPESKGLIRRNEIRHYHREGHIVGATFKTFVLNEMENVLGRDHFRDQPLSSVTICGVMEKHENLPSLTRSRKWVWILFSMLLMAGRWNWMILK
jgi:predicted amidohydrolase